MPDRRRTRPSLERLCRRSSSSAPAASRKSGGPDGRGLDRRTGRRDRHGAGARADVLVNNAGIYPSGFLLDIATAEFDRIFAINLRAPFPDRGHRPADDRSKGVKGSIINISSGAARKMRRTVVPYCTSKTALDRLTKGFAIELAEFGIRVNALEPGFAAGSTVSRLTDEQSTTPSRASRSAGPPRRPTSRTACFILQASLLLRHRGDADHRRRKLHRIARRPPGQEKHPL